MTATIVLLLTLWTPRHDRRRLLRLLARGWRVVPPVGSHHEAYWARGA